MTYLCQGCKKHCEYVDDPPCELGESCEKFQPIKIMTIHIVRKTPEGFRTLCIPLRNVSFGETMFTSHAYAATCVRCLKAAALESEEQENPSLLKTQTLYSIGTNCSFSREDYKQVEWTDLGLPDELLTIILSTNISVFDYREQLLSSTTSIDLSDAYSEIILASLDLEKNQ